MAGPRTHTFQDFVNDPEFKGLPSEEQAKARQMWYDKVVATSPEWESVPDLDKKIIRQDILGQPHQTLEALKGVGDWYKPDFSAGDVSSVFKDPKSTLGGKAAALTHFAGEHGPRQLAGTLMYPAQMFGKTIPLPALGGKLWDVPMGLVGDVGQSAGMGPLMQDLMKLATFGVPWGKAGMAAARRVPGVGGKLAGGVGRQMTSPWLEKRMGIPPGTTWNAMRPGGAEALREQGRHTEALGKLEQIMKGSKAPGTQAPALPNALDLRQRLLDADKAGHDKAMQEALDMLRKLRSKKKPTKVE